ncbi:MAG: hypothetical protein HQM09_18390 [Candidatus Riflebacteria bacterium]|nr:hypothetical protein [Candidatus Riflebacteria bacterium]
MFGKALPFVESKQGEITFIAVEESSTYNGTGGVFLAVVASVRWRYLDSRELG